MNLVTFARNEATVTVREGEVPLANFDNGMNLVGSCSPGVGICTDVVNPKLTDWTVETQFDTARLPQLSMHLGGDGSTVGVESTLGEHPVTAVIGDQNPDGTGSTDINDELWFAVAEAQAAPGVGIGIGNIDPINRSSVTVEIGDRVWATNTVA